MKQLFLSMLLFSNICAASYVVDRIIAAEVDDAVSRLMREVERNVPHSSDALLAFVRTAKETAQTEEEIFLTPPIISKLVEFGLGSIHAPSGIFSFDREKMATWKVITEVIVVDCIDEMLDKENK